MGCSVDEAQERIDAREFREWQHFYSLEPWGPAGDDARAVATTGVLARCMGVKRIRAEWILPWIRSWGSGSATSEASLRATMAAQGVKFIERPAAPGEAK